MSQQNVNVVSSFSVGGYSFEQTLALSGNDVFTVSYSVPAAKAGTLTTRTDNNTGTLTMSAGHGITTGQLLDIYWSGGCRRQVVAGTVSVNSVPIDLGSGDNLPSTSTVIAAMVPIDASFPCVNADLLLLAVRADVEAQFTFFEADDSTEDWTSHVVPAASGRMTTNCWASGMGALPATGTEISQVFLSHADIAAAHVLVATYVSN